MPHPNLHQPVPCAVCGVIVQRTPGEMRRWKQVTCSRVCAGRLRGRQNFRGGRIERDGYILLYMPDHPSADQKGYVREHRVVAEQIAGRRLTSADVVHHINHAKSDNQIDNLHITTVSPHASYHQQGEQHSQSKLTDALVLEILRKHDTGAYRQRDLCLEYGISPAQMCMIVNRKAWRHLR